VVIWGLLEQAEEPIVDDARQLRVFKERNFVNELHLVLCFLRAVSSHGYVHEKCLKVRPSNFIQEFAILSLIEVLYQDDFLIAGTGWVILHGRGVTTWRRAHAHKRTGGAASTLRGHRLRLSQWCQVPRLVGTARPASRIDTGDLLTHRLGLCLSLSARLLAWRIVRFHLVFLNDNLTSA